MVRASGARERAAARDALVERTRKLTGGTLTVSALLSGVFAGVAASYAPGRLLHPKATVRPAASTTRTRPPVTETSTAIPPLPPPPGPGNLSAAPPAPAPAPAPVATQAPPVVVSGGS
jgi:hypothetical protein